MTQCFGGACEIARRDKGRAEFLFGGAESGTDAQRLLAPANSFTGLAVSGICLGQFQVKFGLRGLQAFDGLAQAWDSAFQIGAVADLRDCYVQLPGAGFRIVRLRLRRGNPHRRFPPARREDRPPACGAGCSGPSSPRVRRHLCGAAACGMARNRLRRGRRPHALPSGTCGRPRCSWRLHPVREGRRAGCGTWCTSSDLPGSISIFAGGRPRGRSRSCRHWPMRAASKNRK